MSKQQIDNKIAAVSSSSSSSFFYFFSSLLCIRTGDVRSLPQHMCVCVPVDTYIWCVLWIHVGLSFTHIIMASKLSCAILIKKSLRYIMRIC